MEPLTELNEGGEVCEYGGELHLGYIEFEVPVGFTSGDVGNIYSSDDQEGDMGTLGNVRGKVVRDKNSRKCQHAWDSLGSRRRDRLTPFFSFSLLLSACQVWLWPK